VSLPSSAGDEIKAKISKRPRCIEIPKMKEKAKEKKLKLRELKRNEKQVAGNPSISA